MSWFFIALVAPLLYATTNHIDKILLEKYFKNGGVGTIILFSSLLSIFALPILYFADPTVLTVGIKNILTLAFVGILNILVLWFYLLALNDEEPSITIVFYQLVPVFAFILGYFILGEVLTKTELIAMAIIILGTTIVSFEIDEKNNFKLRKRTIFLMFTASFFWALGSVVFKYVALEDDVWHSLFWEHSMLVLIGITIFIFVPSYRNHFLSSINSNSKVVIILNVANELFYMLGNLIFSFAYLLAPISLVLLTDSFQPFFVLIIGLFLTIFFPELSNEKIHLKNVIQKILAIVITGIGTYLLLVA